MNMNVSVIVSLPKHPKGEKGTPYIQLFVYVQQTLAILGLT